MPIVWTRYPWLLGYLIAPAAFWFVAKKESCFSWAAPLLNTTAPAAVLAACWHFHFLRRATEVVFLNVYHGKSIPNERDSVLEFIYYLIWGLMNGCTAACIKATLSSHQGSVVVIIGLALFVTGQIGNFMCHAYLRSLRMDPTITSWTIPYRWPFSILVAPHYSFEIMSWVGYMLASGMAPPTIFIVSVSVAALSQGATARKEKYMKLYKDGGAIDDLPSPETRWVLIPFVY